MEITLTRRYKYVHFLYVSASRHRPCSSLGDAEHISRNFRQENKKYHEEQEHFFNWVQMYSMLLCFYPSKLGYAQFCCTLCSWSLEKATLSFVRAPAFSNASSSSWYKKSSALWRHPKYREVSPTSLPDSKMWNISFMHNRTGCTIIIWF